MVVDVASGLMMPGGEHSDAKRRHLVGIGGAQEGHGRCEQEWRARRENKINNKKSITPATARSTRVYAATSTFQHTMALPPCHARDRWTPVTTQGRLDLPGIHCADAASLHDVVPRIPPVCTPGTTTAVLSTSALLGGVWSAELTGLESKLFNSDSSSSSSPALTSNVAGVPDTGPASYDGVRLDNAPLRLVVEVLGWVGAIDDVRESTGSPRQSRSGSSP